MRRRRLTPPLIAACLAILFSVRPASAQETRIYWGDDVPAAWNGSWSQELLTVPERTGYARTTSSLQLLEFIDALRWRTEKLHVFNLFVSPRGKAATALVLSNPRVSSPREATESGKPVVYLHGNIHPPESEATEALLMVARDILVGDRGYLLDNQIIVIAPIFNVDGTDTFVLQDGSLGSVTPYILGVRGNAEGIDLNRDAVKLETLEVNGLYQFFNAWNPILFFDGHLMGRVNHGYANTYATSTVPAAHPGPRAYMDDTLFPAVRDRVREEFGLEVFTHSLFSPRSWPPTAWSHDAAAWTTEAKFVVNDFGLRNRMAIITETPGQPTFERRIYAQYAYIMALLEYTNEHAAEMQEVVRAADEETVEGVLGSSESGELRNWLAGEYRSRGKIDVLGYPSVVSEYLPGTSVRGTRAEGSTGEPEVVRGVDDLNLSVGTRDAWMPRGYLIPAEHGDIAAKLEAHNIRVTVLEEPVRAEGEEFLISEVRRVRSRGFEIPVLEGEFVPVVREFPAGTYFVDMAQPMANAAFYYLEPQAADGFVGWGVLDGTLDRIGAGESTGTYPIFKLRS
ncbi:MAG: hypothetical protein MUO50_17785, partial [Longimicrobiales bacterium]|nr:hypothetical protein [Longimicrobiales bacterium]